MNNNQSFTVVLETPSIETYRDLRVRAGLSAKTEEAARRGLPNTLFGVQLLHEGKPIGMGRVIGDGGCFFQVVDIAISPEFQGKGLGKLVMREIMKYVAENVPESAYVSLIADGKAQDLYAQFGFVHTAPASIGMAFQKQPLPRVPSDA